MMRTRALAGLIVAGALLVGGTLSGATFTDAARARALPKASAPDCVTSWTSGTDLPDTATFASGQYDGLWPLGGYLCSPDHRYLAGFQADGNLVGYDRSYTPVRAGWDSWTYNVQLSGKATTARFQADGDLALFNAAGTLLKHTNTAGIPVPATLTVNSAGDLVLTDATGVVRFTSAGTGLTSCRTPGIFTCDVYTDVENTRPV